MINITDNTFWTLVYIVITMFAVNAGLLIVLIWQNGGRK